MEWPKAAWELQKKFLASSKGPDWRYVGYSSHGDCDMSEGSAFMKQLFHSALASMCFGWF